MSDNLDIPDFLRREPMSPEQRSKLLQRSRRWGKRSMFGEGAEKPRRDRLGRPLPRSMDAGSWALLASLDKEMKKAERAKDKAKEEAKEARKRLLASIRPKPKRKGLQVAPEAATIKDSEGLPNEEPT